MRIKFITLFTLVTLIFLPLQAVSADRPADITDDQPKLDFPNTITFHAKLSNSAKITSVVLEYGDQEETCGTVIAKAYPQITPGTSVEAEWTWDMHQSGSLPPGTQIWWRWRYTDETGKESVSDQKTVTWLDSQHHWQVLTAENLNLHWYDIGQSLAQDLLDAAKTGLSRNAQQAGLKPDGPIDVYIYASYNDLQSVVLYEPSWTGGQAFPENNIVIVGLSRVDPTYDRNAVIHELTHVLVGHLTFSCLGSVPQWLNEGLAVYSEGPLDSQFQKPLNQAIQDDTLLSIRSLNGTFSENKDQADLSYGESFSVVQFLIETYGQEKMTALLLSLRDGHTIDEALTSVYNFNVEGLEDAWRQSVGARPREAAPNPTAVPTPTIVPTIVPVSGAPLPITPTPFNFPTPAPSVNQPITGTPTLAVMVIFAACCVAVIVLGVIVLGIVFVIQKRSGGKNEKGS